MGNFKTLFRSKRTTAIIGIPLMIQLVILFIVVPALNKADERSSGIKVVIVNKDKEVGKAITANLKKELPFDAVEEENLKNVLEKLNDHDYSAAIYIPAGLSRELKEGKGRIKYYVNQEASSTLKQILDIGINNINLNINKNAFNTIKAKVLDNMEANFANFTMPQTAIASMRENIGKGAGIMKKKPLDIIKNKMGTGFAKLNNTPITSKIIRVNDSEGFIQNILPFFLFMVYFIASAAVTMLFFVMKQPLENEFSKWAIFFYRLTLNVIAALLIPLAAFTVIWSFNIPYKIGAVSLWFMLSAGFFAFTMLVQFFADLLDFMGIGLAFLIFFPLQMITSNLIFPKEILPHCYKWIREYLPATFFGSGVMKAIYSGSSLAYDTGILLLMALILLAASLICVTFKSRKVVSNNKEINV